MKLLKLCIITVCTLAILTVGALAAAPKKSARPLDGDTVWKQQCSRCHFAPGAIPKKKMATVTRHMRDVGQLTDEEYRAVLGFVTK